MTTTTVAAVTNAAIADMIANLNLSAVGLVEAYNTAIAENALTLEPVKRFASAAVGVQRLVRLCDTYDLKPIWNDISLHLVRAKSDAPTSDAAEQPAEVVQAILEDCRARAEEVVDLSLCTTGQLMAIVLALTPGLKEMSIRPRTELMDDIFGRLGDSKLASGDEGAVRLIPTEGPELIIPRSAQVPEPGEIAARRFVQEEVVPAAAAKKAADAQKPLRTQIEEAAAARKAAAPKSGGGRSGGAKDDNRLITLLADKNPKKPGSAAHARFALYKTSMTVAQFLAAGGTRSDIAWDSSHGFISLG